MEKKTKGKRGGARPGAGRPRNGTREYKFRLTPDQHKKLVELGGSRWLRKQLDEQNE